MFRSVEVRLYPNRIQEQTLNEYLECGRRVWNHFLDHRKKAYSRRAEQVSYESQAVMLTRWRANDLRVRRTPVLVQRDAIRRLDRAMQSFFRRIRDGKKAGYPRFRSKGRWNSFEILEVANYVTESKIRVPKLGAIKCRGIRMIAGVQKALTVILRAGKWFARILIDDGIAKPPATHGNRIIGIDLGIDQFLTTSDGVSVDPPRPFRSLEKKLRKASKNVSRKSAGSSNRKKAAIKKQRVYFRISNIRSDFTHKISRQVVENYDFIAIEDLNIHGLMQYGRLGKSIGDVSWGQFARRLIYKAESAGSIVVSVNPRNTSQECSYCGEITKKTLSEKSHNCDHCGASVCRDMNAARNILARGIKKFTAGRAEIYACGETHLRLAETGRLD